MHLNLLRVNDLHGTSIWINPSKIVSIRPHFDPIKAVEDGCSITTDCGLEFVVVENYQTVAFYLDACIQSD
jgi:hypothetical protein